MAKPIHSMIRVLDEARSLDFYRRAFGMEVVTRWDFETFTLVYLASPEDDFELELTVNKDRTEPYQHGDAYGHLAVVVEDVEAEHARFVAEALSPLDVKQFHRDGTLIAKFFFVSDPDGYKIEVLQRHGRFK